MSEHRELILKALYGLLGDDLQRAKAAFRHLSFEQMQQQYGHSGKTFQQILDEYQQHNDKVMAAIEWVKQQ